MSKREAAAHRRRRRGSRRPRAASIACCERAGAMRVLAAQVDVAALGSRSRSRRSSSPRPRAKGSPSMSTRSLNVPGSLSSALHDQVVRAGRAGAATACHLRPVGNAAPPRPTRPRLDAPRATTPVGPELDRRAQRRRSRRARGSRRGWRGRRRPTRRSSTSAGSPRLAAPTGASPAPSDRGVASGVAPASDRRRAAGARSHRPRHGLGERVAALGRQPRAATASPTRAGEVVAHVDDPRAGAARARTARRSEATPYASAGATASRRHDLVEAARADPARRGRCSGVQRRQQQVAPVRGVAVRRPRSVARRSVGRPTTPIDRCRARRRRAAARRRGRTVHEPGRRSVTRDLSTRTAVALNSAVPDLGSVASIVSTLVSTSSGKWNVMNARPGRRPASMRTGADHAPRRDDDPDRLARRRRRARAASSGDRSMVSPRAQRRRDSRRICTPVL